MISYQQVPQQLRNFFNFNQMFMNITQDLLACYIFQGTGSTFFSIVFAILALDTGIICLKLKA